jgi:CarD family transcriptional regulator
MIGIRPVIGRDQYQRLLSDLQSDFEDVSSDWKTRSREFQEKIQSGDVFAAADVLKKLTYLSHEKKLSFREQTMLEKARYLIVSEIVNADCRTDNEIATKVSQLVESACSKHVSSHPGAAASATVH